jgi:oligosaccharide reducing-end xylanase
MLRALVRFDPAGHLLAAARVLALSLALGAAGCGGGDHREPPPPPPPPPPVEQGAYYTGEYPNLFVDVLGKTQAEVDAKVADAFDQLFFPANSAQQIYFELGSDEANIQGAYGTGKDVRSEGMSYGMMIAVQLDRKDVFDRLWTWSKNHMQNQTGPLRGYFAWQLAPDGTVMDPAPAPDGEEWYVTALFMAAHRWGSGTGIYDYAAEAQNILDTSLHAAEQSDRADPQRGAIGDMFGATNHLVLFQPFGEGAQFTDPSYHLPAFYELWARWADKDQTVWCQAAAASRNLIAAAADATSGLSPDYSGFGGAPYQPSWSSPPATPTQDHRNSLSDAQRVASNVGVDQLWFNRGGSDVQVVQHLLAFYRSDGLTPEGVATFCNTYTLAGSCLSNRTATFKTSSGLLAMAGAGVHATVDPTQYQDFLQALWDAPVPVGSYYGGLLYMLGLLEASGNFRVYHPAGGSPVAACE